MQSARPVSGIRVALAMAAMGFMGTAGVAAGAGIAVFKEQPYHRDSTATAVAYSRVIDSPGPYLRFVAGGRNVDVLRSKLAAYIELPDGVPANITGDEDITPVREALGSLKDFAGRYTKSAPLLAPRIEGLAAHVAQYDAGKLRYQGVWMEPSEFGRVQEKRREEAEALERKEIEDLAFEAAQREKGLVPHQGKWIPKEETKNSPQPGDSDLASALTPLQSGDLRGARFAIYNLSVLEAGRKGAEKVRTERLRLAVRNLFLAEFRISEQILAGTVAAHEAAVHEKNARNWLKPNAFGKINREAARDSRRKAAEVLQLAGKRLDVRKNELREQLRETETVIADFEKLGETGVVLRLREAVRVIQTRNFTPGEIQKPDDGESSGVETGP